MEERTFSREKYQITRERFWASVIDGIVIIPIVVLNEYISENQTSDVVLIASLIIFTAVTYLYSVVMHAFFGQTIGKMLMRIRVFDVLEIPITFRQAVLRDIVPLIAGVALLCADVYFISTDRQNPDEYDAFYNIANNILLAWTVLELVSMLTNEKRRSIHDFIAGTVVVKINK